MIAFNLKTVASVVTLVVAGATVFSCRHKVDVEPCAALPTIVSFHHDILPLFDTYCNQTTCHSSVDPGGNLDLSDSAAYAELLHPGSGYVDTLNPTASVLYIQITSTSQPTPPTGKLDDCKIQLVLKWIQQHAPNN